MADELAVLVKNLTGVAGPVFVELPHNAEIKALPCVDLTPVGPAQRRPGMNVLGVDLVDVDVDIYTTVAASQSGEAHQLAETVRRRLTRLYGTRIRTLDVGRPERRPDRNPNIRRVGVTVTLGIPVNP